MFLDYFVIMSQDISRVPLMLLCMTLKRRFKTDQNLYNIQGELGYRWAFAPNNPLLRFNYFLSTYIIKPSICKVLAFSVI